MVQATTPTFVLTLPETVDLTQAQNLYFTMKQGCVTVQKETADLTVDGQTVSVYLTQSETLQFGVGNASLQLNWTYPDGSRACTNIVTIIVDPNLLKDVVE